MKFRATTTKNKWKVNCKVQVELKSNVRKCSFFKLRDICVFSAIKHLLMHSMARTIFTYFIFVHIFICSMFLYWSNNCKIRLSLHVFVDIQNTNAGWMTVLIFLLLLKKMKNKCANSWVNEYFMPEKLSSLFELYIQRLKVSYLHVTSK